MGNTYFFTGYPGFIAAALLNQIVNEQYPIDHIYLLVLPNLREKAEQEVQLLDIPTERLTIVTGDITEEQLGIEDRVMHQLRSTVTHVFHLAAVYDLAVSKDIAYNVNVVGTKHVNEFVRSVANLQRYVYFSTAYVSGTRNDIIYEHELEMNQVFKNHYESTKYEAEVLVKKLQEEVSTTIIRPGVVRGNSETGETIKFDGPYFMLNCLNTLKFLPIIPYLSQGKAEGNFVPVDYIFKASIYLGHEEIGSGKTYHLTDPNPYTMREVYQMLCEEYLGKTPKGTIPLGLTKLFLSFSPFRKWFGAEKEGLDYFTCLARYDTSQAEADLKNSGITCPNFKDTLKPMVRFYKEHRSDVTKHIKIN